MKRIVVLFLACLFLLFCGCDSKGANAEGAVTRTNVLTEKETTATGVNREKQKVVEMFMEYGTYQEKGSYQFKKSYNKGDECHLYLFTYYPDGDMFSVYRSVSTYASALYTVDTGEVYFTWETKGTPVFWAQHYIYHEQSSDILSAIKFEFSVDRINSDMTFDNYTYKVTENSYAHVNESQMAKYAEKCADYTMEAMVYAQSIVSAYTEGITLW